MHGVLCCQVTLRQRPEPRSSLSESLVKPPNRYQTKCPIAGFEQLPLQSFLPSCDLARSCAEKQKLVTALGAAHQPIIALGEQEVSVVILGEMEAAHHLDTFLGKARTARDCDDASAT